MREITTVLSKRGPARHPPCACGRTHYAKGKCRPCYEKQSWSKRHREQRNEARLAYRHNWYMENRERVARMGRKRYLANREQVLARQNTRYSREAQRERRLKASGWTTPEFIAAEREQLGCCAICGVRPERLVPDHNHATGTRRGLLCNTCNPALGAFKDSPKLLQAAIAYLEKWGNQ
jgi:Autographiviridae endonuclease VII